MKILNGEARDVLNWLKRMIEKKVGYTQQEIECASRLHSWHNSLESCTHESLIRVTRVLANGTIAHYLQCQHCGWGRAVKKEGADPVATWCDESQEVRNLMWKLSQMISGGATKISDEFSAAFDKNAAFWKLYNDHLSSEKWRELRSLVIDRAGGVCEGCRKRQIEQVHHKTYAHLGNEFCFELIGLCKDCHTRYHGV